MEWLSPQCLVLLSLLVLTPVVDGLRDSLKCPVRVLKGGRVRIRSKGRVAKYVCLRGSQVLGDKYSTCVRGKWDSPVPICINSGCLPVAVPHGQVLETYRGALATVHCDPGYALIGSQSLYCNGATWNDTAPTCREVQVRAQKWCDFESEDLCGWTHDLNHDFDWRRHNFATPSGHVGTGPSFDHSLGPGLNGHYMYLEVSSPRLENDTARLFSPVFNAISDPGACFIFWYHMYGSTTGTLNVYLHKQDTVLLFNKSGDQGNQWLQAIVSLPQTNSSFQIVMEGVRGTGYEGDIAIDDVKLAEGQECTLSTSTPAGDQETGAVENGSSCEGRCSFPAAEPSMCECTPDCIGNNTCCPDYVQQCSNDTADATIESATTLKPNISAATTTTLRTETSSVLYTTSTNLPATQNINLSTPTLSYYSPTNHSLINVTSKMPIDNVSAPLNLTPSLSPLITTPAKAPNITEVPTTIDLPVMNQTEAKPNTTTTVVTTKFTLIPNVTTTTTTLSTTSPFVFTMKTTLPSIKINPTRRNVAPPTSILTLLITRKPLLEFVTPPPDVVFRIPAKRIRPITKYYKTLSVAAPTTVTTSTTITTSTTVTTRSPKTNFNKTEKVPKSKNDVLHPVWLKDPLTTPTLSPLTPNPNTQTTKTTMSTSYSTTTLPSTTMYFQLSTSTTPPTKWKSKYKPKEEEPVHAQYAVPSSQSGHMVHIMVLVSGVLLILGMTLAAACVLRRRKINRRRMEDDELDIQFLASDEILDFTLARPSMEDIQMKETRR